LLGRSTTGVTAYFGAKNAEGDVRFGDEKTRTVQIEALDDAYDPQRAAANKLKRRLRGDRSDAAYQQWLREQQIAAVWECVAREVVLRNARIAVLRAHVADDAAASAAVPAAFGLAGQPVGELRAWVAEVDRLIADAERVIEDRARNAVEVFIGSVLAEAVRARGRRPGRCPGPRRWPATAASAPSRWRSSGPSWSTARTSAGSCTGWRST
jgi:hypothetical protein